MTKATFAQTPHRRHTDTSQQALANLLHTFTPLQQAINKSLSALASVFTGLAQGASHVPFRDSKLTYLLQDCLAGDGKALMFVNLSPTMESLPESLQSLRFARQVNQVELGKATKMVQLKGADGSAGGAPGGGVRRGKSMMERSTKATAANVVKRPNLNRANTMAGGAMNRKAVRHTSTLLEREGYRLVPLSASDCLQPVAFTFGAHSLRHLMPFSPTTLRRPVTHATPQPPLQSMRTPPNNNRTASKSPPRAAGAAPIRRMKSQPNMPRKRSPSPGHGRPGPAGRGNQASKQVGFGDIAEGASEQEAY